VACPWAAGPDHESGVCGGARLGADWASAGGWVLDPFPLFLRVCRDKDCIVNWSRPRRIRDQTLFFNKGNFIKQTKGLTCD
jgi:hypothetical protein